jgi:hypothetical protein
VSSQRPENEDTDRMIVWPPTTKHSSDHYNKNNSNNNNLSSQSSTSSRGSSSWKETLERILKPRKSRKNSSIQSKSGSSITSRQNGKHVHWIDNDKAILNSCHHFVENLKLFVQNILDNQYEENYLKNCEKALDELHTFIDCSELKQAFNHSIELANKNEKYQLLQQQTHIAHLISHTVLS